MLEKKEAFEQEIHVPAADSRLVKVYETHRPGLNWFYSRYDTQNMQLHLQMYMQMWHTASVW